MEQFVSLLRKEVRDTLREIENRDSNLLNKAHEAILVLESAFIQLKSFAMGYDFKETKLPINTSALPKIKMTWTGKKAELVEQIYGWMEAKCLNNGNVSIKELVEYMENVFNINLGDYYHVFIEMRERSGSRTLFLDKLIKLLNKRMNDADRIK